MTEATWDTCRELIVLNVDRIEYDSAIFLVLANDGDGVDLAFLLALVEDNVVEDGDGARIDWDGVRKQALEIVEIEIVGGPRKNNSRETRPTTGSSRMTEKLLRSPSGQKLSASKARH